MAFGCPLGTRPVSSANGQQQLEPGRQAGGLAGALARVWITCVPIWTAKKWLCGRGKSLLSARSFPAL